MECAVEYIGKNVTCHFHVCPINYLTANLVRDLYFLGYHCSWGKSIMQMGYFLGKITRKSFLK